MNDLIHIAQILDDLQSYSKSDCVMKVAIDLSTLKDLHGPSGMAGKFVTIPNQQHSFMKNQLGQLPQQSGVKFYKPNYSITNLASENLALIYFSPWINKKTDIKAPYVGMMPLSAIIQQKAAVVQKMPGKHLEEHNALDNLITNVTMHKILYKLAQIGIIWHDCHIGNFLVDENKYNQLSETYEYLSEKERKEFEKQKYLFDLSSNASIVDFGLMECYPDSGPGVALLKLYNKLQKNKNNSLFNIIRYAIDDIIII